MVLKLIILKRNLGKDNFIYIAFRTLGLAMLVCPMISLCLSMNFLKTFSVFRVYIMLTWVTFPLVQTWSWGSCFSETSQPPNNCPTVPLARQRLHLSNEIFNYNMTYLTIIFIDIWWSIDFCWLVIPQFSKFQFVQNKYTHEP